MERETFISAVEQYQDMVYRLALHYFGEPQDAEDAVQEVFLRLYRQNEPFGGVEHLRRWLVRVTINICKDVLKSPWRKRRAYPENIPEQPVFDHPDQSLLFHEVMSLPEKYRTVLYLYYYEEFSTREIALTVGIRQSAVTTRLVRAREQLKKKLGERWCNEK